MNLRCGAFISYVLHLALPCYPAPSSHPPLPCHADFPPTLFVSMVKDPKQSAKIGADWSILTEEGSPVGIIRVGGF